MDQRDLEVPAEGLHHLLGLAGPQQPVVDEHAGELLADGPVDEQGGHRRVHAAGQRAQDLVLPHLVADPLHGPLDHVDRRPLGQQAAALVEEPLQHVLAVRGVGHLGVELDGEQAPVGVLHGGDRDGRRAGRDGEPGGAAVTVSEWLIHTVSSAGRSASSTPGSATDSEVRPYSRTPGVLDPAAQGPGHDLLAVADPEHRDAEGEHGGSRSGAPGS